MIVIESERSFYLKKLQLICMVAVPDSASRIDVHPASGMNTLRSRHWSLEGSWEAYNSDARCADRCYIAMENLAETHLCHSDYCCDTRPALRDLPYHIDLFIPVSAVPSWMKRLIEKTPSIL